MEKQKSNEEWARYMKRYEAVKPTTTIVAFCAQEGINVGSFQSARQRLKNLGFMPKKMNGAAKHNGNGNGNGNGFTAFVPAEIAPIRVERNGSTISISTPAMLREVLDILEGRGN